LTERDGSVISRCAVAKKEKKLREELKHDDQFVVQATRVTERVADFANRNTRALVIGITTLATVIVGSVVLSQISEGRRARASAALDHAQRLASAELTTPNSPPKEDGVPHFATAKERNEAALKEIDGYFKSSSTPLYLEAMLVRGSLLLDLDRADEAASVYEKVLQEKIDDRLTFLAREGLGYTYERKGKLPEAQTVFTKLAEDSGGFYKDRALYHEARLAELRGNPADATRIYHEVLEKHPTSSLREEITNRLAVLELK
jgi:tetratricopeptide (TPR) repeat protein